MKMGENHQDLVHKWLIDNERYLVDPTTDTVNQFQFWNEPLPFVTNNTEPAFRVIDIATAFQRTDKSENHSSEFEEQDFTPPKVESNACPKIPKKGNLSPKISEKDSVKSLGDPEKSIADIVANLTPAEPMALSNIQTNAIELNGIPGPSTSRTLQEPVSLFK